MIPLITRHPLRKPIPTLLFSLALATLLTRHSHADSPPPPPMSDALRAQFSKLLADLASTDFQTRQTAQNQLDSLPVDQRDNLQQLADSTHDLEVKTRLLAGIDAIDFHAALNPPPISVDLKNASLFEVEAALAKATGAEIGYPDSTPTPAEAKKEFNLTAKDQPFWTVFNELSHQDPLHISWSSTGWSLRIGSTVPPQGLVSIGGIAAHVQTAGSFAFWPSVVQRVKGPAGTDQYRIYFSMAADPRMRVVQAGFPAWKEILDNNKNNLAVVNGTGAGGAMAVRSGVWVRQTTVDVPAHPGETISMKGEMKVVVGWHDVSTAIPTPDKHLNENLPFSGATIKITQFQITDKQTYKEVLMSLQITWPPTPQAAPITATILDATGKQLCTGIFISGSSTIGVGLPFKEPLSLHLTMPSKTKEVTIPVELKDIVLP